MGNESREGGMAAAVPSSVLTEEASTNCGRGTWCGRGRRMRGEPRGRQRVDGGKACDRCRFGPAAAAMACCSLRACCLLSCVVQAGLLNGRWSSPCWSERGEARRRVAETLPCRTTACEGRRDWEQGWVVGRARARTRGSDGGEGEGSAGAARCGEGGWELGGSSRRRLGADREGCDGGRERGCGGTERGGVLLGFGIDGTVCIIYDRNAIRAIQPTMNGPKWLGHLGRNGPIYFCTFIFFLFPFHFTAQLWSNT
jgi:hypothetical protein